MSDPEGIYAVESRYLDRHVQIGVASGKVISVSFPRTPDEGAGDDHPVLDRIDAYLDGVREEFSDTEVALTLPTDQRSVLETVREIPYGQQVNVEELANMTPGIDATDDDTLDLTVRTALDANPVPILIPDHRVRDGPSGAPPEVEQRLRSLEEL